MRALKGLQSLGRGSKIRDKKMLANQFLQARETVSFQIQVGGRSEQLGSDLHYLTIRQTWDPLYVNFQWYILSVSAGKWSPEIRCPVHYYGSTVVLIAKVRILESPWEMLIFWPHQDPNSLNWRFWQLSLMLQGKFHSRRSRGQGWCSFAF